MIQSPPDLKKTWFCNFEKMREIGEIKYYRAIVPNDALNMNIETIDTADASENMICVAMEAIVVNWSLLDLKSCHKTHQSRELS